MAAVYWNYEKEAPRRNGTHQAGAACWMTKNCAHTPESPTDCLTESPTKASSNCCVHALRPLHSLEKVGLAFYVWILFWPLSILHLSVRRKSAEKELSAVSVNWSRWCQRQRTTKNVTCKWRHCFRIIAIIFVINWVCWVKIFVPAVYQNLIAW